MRHPSKIDKGAQDEYRTRQQNDGHCHLTDHQSASQAITTTSVGEFLLLASLIVWLRLKPEDGQAGSKPKMVVGTNVQSTLTNNTGPLICTSSRRGMSEGAIAFSTSTSPYA
jgi:hypothetical protein